MATVPACVLLMLVGLLTPLMRRMVASIRLDPQAMLSFTSALEAGMTVLLEGLWGPDRFPSIQAAAQAVTKAAVDKGVGTYKSKVLASISHAVIGSVASAASQLGAAGAANAQNAQNTPSAQNAQSAQHAQSAQSAQNAQNAQNAQGRPSDHSSQATSSVLHAVGDELLAAAHMALATFMVRLCVPHSMHVCHVPATPPNL